MSFPTSNTRIAFASSLCVGVPAAAAAAGSLSTFLSHGHADRTKIESDSPLLHLKPINQVDASSSGDSRSLLPRRRPLHLFLPLDVREKHRGTPSSALVDHSAATARTDLHPRKKCCLEAPAANTELTDAALPTSSQAAATPLLRKRNNTLLNGKASVPPDFATARQLLELHFLRHLKAASLVPIPSPSVGIPSCASTAAIVGLLHRYNETKDAAQNALGLLAQREGLSLHDLYGRLNIRLGVD